MRKIDGKKFIENLGLGALFVFMSSYMFFDFTNWKTCVAVGAATLLFAVFTSLKKDK